MLSLLPQGAGIAGAAAAKTLTDFGCKVLILEARDYIGGRMPSQIVTEGGYTFPVHLGANWIHGDSDNPLFCLNNQLDLVWTQQFPNEGTKFTDPAIANSTRTFFRARSGNVYDTLPNGIGNLSLPLGALVRAYMVENYDVNVGPYIMEVNATGNVFGVPDVPVNRQLDFYLKKYPDIKGDLLDMLLIVSSSSSSLASFCQHRCLLSLSHHLL